MNIKDLAIIKPEKKVVKLKDAEGKEHNVDVYMKPLPFHLTLREQNKEDEDGMADLVAARVAHCICDEDGNPIFTKEQVKGTAEKSISAEMAITLTNLVSEFNGMSEKKGKHQKT